MVLHHFIPLRFHSFSLPLHLNIHFFHPQSFHSSARRSIFVIFCVPLYIYYYTYMRCYCFYGRCFLFAVMVLFFFFLWTVWCALCTIHINKKQNWLKIQMRSQVHKSVVAANVCCRLALLTLYVCTPIHWENERETLSTIMIMIIIYHIRMCLKYNLSEEEQEQEHMHGVRP